MVQIVFCWQNEKFLKRFCLGRGGAVVDPFFVGQSEPSTSMQFGWFEVGSAEAFVFRKGADTETADVVLGIQPSITSCER